jgi:hypothetical protein
MPQLTKPMVIYHADWGSKDEKRWCARATLGTDGLYTAFAPKPVGNLGSLMGQLRTEAGETGCAFAGFDFPIGVPAYYAERAGISNFRTLLRRLGHGKWKDFYSVCDKPGEISVNRPFYPNGAYEGRRKEDLFRGNQVENVEPLLRRCERGGNGHKQACCLFWTLGGNQVGKAAIIGWRDVLVPEVRSAGPISLWPFDGDLPSLLVPGNIIVAETYPAECYAWFCAHTVGSKRKQESRKKFGALLLDWAHCHEVTLANCLSEHIQRGFPQGDDAFDAVVGLFGMLKVCIGERASGEPDERIIKQVEGWILGREP